MKNKWIKKLGIIFAAFLFLFVITGCSGNAYDGDFCGNAKKSSTEFGKIRATYISEAIAVIEDVEGKYIIENESVVSQEAITDTTLKKQATYLFVLYTDYYGNEEHQLKSKEIISNFIGMENGVTYVSESNTFSGDDDGVQIATNALKRVKALSEDYIDWIKTPSRDSKKYKVGKEETSVKTQLSSYSKACFVVGKDGVSDPGGSGVLLKNKTWGDAFKVGPFTGLIVFPMAWILNTFVNWFGGSGLAQVAAILLVTLLVKLLVMLITFKGTMSTHKMQDIQPEIAKIQAKYGNTKAPEARQRMSMEMMSVYKKYNIKPFAPFLSLIITFPIFIGMYRAVTQTAILRTGNFLGVTLGTTISSNIIGSFKIGALCIFLFMAATQILSMKLPTLLNRKRMTLEAKRAQKQTNMMSNVFMVMILVMGFMMPVTMSIYWIASALSQILQTIIMHHINNAAKGKGKYKLKKIEKKYSIPQGTKKES